MTNNRNYNLQRSLTLATIAGCLAMVYMPAVSGVMATDYFRHLGFTERHIGILTGMGMIMVTLQFFGALWSNRLRRRKPPFMVLLITGRLLWLGVILVPVLTPHLAPNLRIGGMLILIGISAALSSLSMPIWYTWMGDLIPRRILNRYWGGRYRWMWLVQVIVSVGLTVFSFFYQKLGLSLSETFSIVVVIGVTAGVVDVVLFIWIPEPENLQVRGRKLLSILLEPLAEPGCRSFLIWSCAHAAAVMIAASFMQYYMLKVLAIPQWQVLLVWSSTGLGYAMASAFWGRVADRHGHRPIFVLCSTLKPLIPLAFFLVTAKTALFVLLPFIFFDSLLNAGNMLAKTGFMLKLAPRENRSMFVAAMMSFPAIVGGLSAMLGGELLVRLKDLEFTFAGWQWNNYRLLFALSVVLRACCIPLAHRIREPASSRPRQVLLAIAGTWPMRLISFPVGLYRRVTRAAKDKNTPGKPPDPPETPK